MSHPSLEWLQIQIKQHAQEIRCQSQYIQDRGPLPIKIQKNPNVIPAIPINFPIHLRYLWSKVWDDPMPMTMARMMHQQEEELDRRRLNYESKFKSKL